MRAYIGPYVYRWTTSSFENWWYGFRYGEEHNRWTLEDDQMDVWDHRMERVTDWWQDVLNATVNRYWKDRQQRKIRVKLHKHDTWGMDDTLSHVIYPMLLQLKEHKNGSPFTDPEDVPENLRPTEAAGPDNGYVDNTIHERWDWVIGEMIWAFEQKVKEDGGEDQFWTSHGEHKMEPIEGSTLKTMVTTREPVYDRDALNAHCKRRTNGFRLFGKYFEGLWA